jgi:hypothetical protein
MKMKRTLVNHLAAAFLVLLGATALRAQDPASGRVWPEDDVAYEFVGLVKNAPPAGAGLPATSIQYGYLTFLNGVSADQHFAGAPSEKTAHFTFFNDSVTRQVISNGVLRMIIREGTTTIYFDDNPLGDRDLTADPAANAETFRRGVVVQTSTWRHQVIIDPTTAATPRTDLFFVNFWHRIQSADSFTVGGQAVKLGKEGDKFRVSLVGGPDPLGKANGKFIGYAVAQGSKK